MRKFSPHKLEERYAGAMIRNRSVPADLVLPHVFYEDLGAAIEWLSRAFGFVEHFRYGEPVSGAQVHLGNAWIMLSTSREGRRSPAELGFATQSLTIFWNKWKIIMLAPKTREPGSWKNRMKQSMASSSTPPKTLKAIAGSSRAMRVT
jgi:hypothetical protein